MLSRSALKILQKGRRFISDSFTSGTNAWYMENLFDQYKQNPESVHASWRAYFKGLETGQEEPYTPPPSLSPSASLISTTPISSNYIRDAHKAVLLLQSFQRYGYMLADLDPLNLTLNVNRHLADVRIPGPIRLENYKFTESDMDKEFDIGSSLITGFLSSTGQWGGKWKLRDIIDMCKKVYCGKIGFEYMHIPFRDECNWVRANVEKAALFSYSPKEKKELHYKVAKAQMLEEFFHKKFSTHKRFGMDGLEGAILAVEAVIERAAEHGVTDFVIGMPHRGRLNVMANVLLMNLEEMFGLFFGTGYKDVDEGDVKYHLGQTVEREINGKKVTIRLLANPSHLEAVDPVAVGLTRAIQNTRLSRKSAMCIMIHGDAALSGQGVVYETLQFEDLHDYSTGGVVHLVFNNNIGFTTVPKDSRSGLFPTEVAKSIAAPIFHVNADFPEEIDFVSRLASDWRNEFRKSVFVDVIGYRRYGHNELDEPNFTNPQMYQLIKEHTPVLQLYTKRLVEEGVYTKEQVAEVLKGLNDIHEKSFLEAKKSADSFVHKPYTLEKKEQKAKSDPNYTGVKEDILKELGTKVNTLPADLRPHPQVAKLYKNRLNAIEKGAGIDWSTAESLAWATILTCEKFPVRISGQDVERGTFSQRHSIVHDQQEDRKKYCPLSHLETNQAVFNATNSHLSEFGVLGFEYGYSIVNPNSLIMWEAQFGDFANGAQIIIDQFLTSGEAKWGQESGLVMLLPHGYDGQGAEHSCARLGRFLQLSSEYPYAIPENFLKDRKENFFHNIQVVVPSTPANYFHFLRRQIKREFRKPLIVMSPKRLLRHKEAVSNIGEFSEDRVKRVYDDWTPELTTPSSVRKVLLCSGQIYYDLVEERKKRNINDIALVRVEQISPFPFDKVKFVADKYVNAQFQWVQEEPLNLGAWQYVCPRIKTAIGSRGEDLSAVTRKPSAAAATGYSSVHTAELLDLLDKAMH